MSADSSTTYEQLAELSADEPTLIEGLPGHGLVASIAVDLLNDQLDLTHCGNITSDAFPPVTTFDEGFVQDLVRVYGCGHPAVMTLQSDLTIPETAYEPLSRCVIEDVASEIGRAIFIAAAPANSEEQLGEVTAIATTEAIRDELEAADIEMADERGVVGGVTGALVRQCYQAGVPAALLVVRAHPQLPDPRAAKSVVENALEPLVDFDVDTTPLDEQAEEIQQRMQQVADQFQQAQQANGQEATNERQFRSKGSGMYQ
ncbi:ATP-grasp superfamily enzyme [Halovivax ruber XH-70]|uniref:ATP-grasp superfamily enzyme n=1 Tax=Halovivax ruber (strain DSM 18193 / JCM 13892 / XH-70) TaxID=797302 RepID=L0IGA6_HALRX|nr:PAC2 family protein [Halovivax ruber]AGB17017.1 ATP-grasp superfamily enzyme [Halovivax ruber XH-70]